MLVVLGTGLPPAGVPGPPVCHINQVSHVDFHVVGEMRFVNIWTL